LVNTVITKNKQTMSKKDFKGTLSQVTGAGGLSSLIPDGVELKRETRGRPRTYSRKITKSSQDKTPEGETRATFIVREDLLEKIKAVAYWERARIKDIINGALVDVVERYEAEHGEIKPIPEKE
jgi:hypothetical protein